MKNKLLLAGICVLALAVTSCNVQKRVYRDGWYVSGNHHNSNNSSVAEVKNTVPLQSEDVVDEPVRSESVSSRTTTSNNEVILVTEAAKSKSNAYTVVDTEPQNTSTSNDGVQPSTAQQKSVQKQKASPPAPGGKSQVVALILCILLGLIGIHRFYLGYTGIGILMIFTVGVFGILWLIDLIRIVTGSLKPKGGEYSETL